MVADKDRQQIKADEQTADKEYRQSEMEKGILQECTGDLQLDP